MDLFATLLILALASAGILAFCFFFMVISYGILIAGDPFSWWKWRAEQKQKAADERDDGDPGIEWLP